MREIDGEVLLSASDLMRFMGCAHATALDLARMRGQGPKPREDTEDAELLQKQGDAHEAAHLSTAARKSATWRRKTRPVARRRAPWPARSSYSWRGPWRFGP